MLAEVILLPAVVLGGLCEFPTPPDCHMYRDLNCDYKDLRHCHPYDVDTTLGDCVSDEVDDDFWTFIDDNGDGFIDCNDPYDLLLLAPDFLPDGIYANPACDKWSEDLAQGSDDLLPILRVPDAMTVEVVVRSFFSQVDLVRGDVGQLAFGPGGVDLGLVSCLADDLSGDNYVPVADPATPASGKIFFYVSRGLGGSVVSGHFYPYGFGQCQERTVQPGNGDCAP